MPDKKNNEQWLMYIFLSNSTIPKGSKASYMDFKKFIYFYTYNMTLLDILKQV